MEPPSTPSLYADRDGERGAGGKLKRPSARKPPTTPYARPPANPNDRRSAGGWWSKFVDPAKRLVSGGATMLLPYFFSQSISDSAFPLDEEQNNLDLGILPNANQEDESDSSHAVPKLTGLIAPSEIESERLMTNCNSEVDRGSPNNSKDDSKVSRIEQLIEGKSFSRGEVNRLMAILKSRVDGREERNEVNTLSGQAEGVLWTPSSRKPNEGNKRDVDKDILRTPLPLPQSNVHDAVGASPVDIAKAYMGNRSLELGTSPRSTLSVDQTDEVVFNPFAASTAFEPSTCWPGAVVQNPRNFSTPSQRPRFGLHDFPRTPYSRTIHSKSRDKLQADSRSLSTSLNPYQQSRTPIFGQEKLRNHIPYDSYGSVGPIRRIRNKFASEARTRGSNFASPKDVPSLFQQRGVSECIILPSEKDPENQPEISLPEPVRLLNPSPSQAVKRILEQLDRKKPTPKEKADELMFAASWRNTPAEASYQKQKVSFSFPQSGDLQPPKKTDFVDPMFLSKDRPNGGNCSSHIQSPEESVTPKRDVPISATPPGLDSGVSGTRNAVDPLGSSVGLNNNPSLQFSSSQEAQPPSRDTGGAGASTNLLSLGQSNGQHSTSTNLPNRTKSALLHKPPQTSSVSKPNLAYISVGRRGLGHAATSENGAGFTFPVSTSSSAFAEPPTPSVMPFSSNNLPSHSKEEPLVPSYSFGSKSAARIVFSFPSTSSIPVVNAPDLKFDFGTDKKNRLCFGSVGKDAICC